MTPRAGGTTGSLPTCRASRGSGPRSSNPRTARSRSTSGGCGVLRRGASAATSSSPRGCCCSPCWSSSRSSGTGCSPRRSRQGLVLGRGLHGVEERARVGGRRARAGSSLAPEGADACGERVPGVAATRLRAGVGLAAEWSERTRGDVRALACAVPRARWRGPSSPCRASTSSCVRSCPSRRGGCARRRTRRGASRSLEPERRSGSMRCESRVTPSRIELTPGRVRLLRVSRDHTGCESRFTCARVS